MSSIIRRAKDLDCINYDRYKYFSIEFSRLGYHRDEPFKVSIDHPSVINKGRNLMKDELGYSDDDFHAAAQVNGSTALYAQAGNSIPVTIFEAMFKEMIL